MDLSGQLHASSILTPDKRVSGTHRTGGLVGSRADVDYFSRKSLSLPGFERGLFQPIA
jgi:hypothetical protein